VRHGLYLIHRTLEQFEEPMVAASIAQKLMAEKRFPLHASARAKLAIYGASAMTDFSLHSIGLTVVSRPARRHRPSGPNRARLCSGARGFDVD
jgi:hypothetical protein